MDTQEKGCMELREEKLDLINTLMPKVEEADFQDDCCIHVLVKADEGVKKVLIECGITEDEYGANIDDGLIDLNIVGFRYGNWFDRKDGYSIVDREQKHIDTDETVYTVDDIVRQIYNLSSRIRCPLYGVSGGTTIQELFNDNIE